MNDANADRDQLVGFLHLLVSWGLSPVFLGIDAVTFEAVPRGGAQGSDWATIATTWRMRRTTREPHPSGLDPAGLAICRIRAHVVVRILGRDAVRPPGQSQDRYVDWRHIPAAPVPVPSAGPYCLSERELFLLLLASVRNRRVDHRATTVFLGLGDMLCSDYP